MAQLVRNFPVGQLVRPLDSVGCYVPGGRHPLVSTLLMTVIPAQVAGVKNIRVVSPQPASREVLARRAMLGVEEFYRVGGAQAIAAWLTALRAFRGSIRSLARKSLRHGGPRN